MSFFILSILECLEQGWAKLPTGEPQRLLEFGRVVGIGADGWSVVLSISLDSREQKL